MLDFASFYQTLEVVLGVSGDGMLTDGEVELSTSDRMMSVKHYLFAQQKPTRLVMVTPLLR